MEIRTILVTGLAINEQAANLAAENGYDVAYVPPYTNEDDLVRIVGEIDPFAVIVRTGRFGASAIDATTCCDIPVVFATGANARSVAEHAIALLLTTVKRIVPLDRSLWAGRWEKAEFLGSF
jgi:D-3-phosphoglycerate dehydrogenase